MFLLQWSLVIFQLFVVSNAEEPGHFLSLESLQSCSANDDISDAMVMAFDTYENHKRGLIEDVHPTVGLKEVEGWEVISLPGYVLRNDFTKANIRVKVWKNVSHLFVAFRGTVMDSGGFDNVWTDLNFSQVLFNNTCWVHAGFHDAFQAIKPHLDKVLDEEQMDKHRVVFVGHSLGGALATLAAVEYCGHVISFGSPHVGGLSFQNLFDSRIQSAHRVVNSVDIVPRLLESVNIATLVIKSVSSAVVEEVFVHSPFISITLDSHMQVTLDVFSNFDNNDISTSAMALANMGLDSHTAFSYARNMNTCRSGRVMELVTRGTAFVWNKTSTFIINGVKTVQEKSKISPRGSLLSRTVSTAVDCTGMLLNGIGHAVTNLHIHYVRGEISDMKKALASGFEESLMHMQMIQLRLESLANNIKDVKENQQNTAIELQNAILDTQHKLLDANSKHHEFDAQIKIATLCFRIDEPTETKLSRCRNSLISLTNYIQEKLDKKGPGDELSSRFLPLIDKIITGQWMYLTLIGKYNTEKFKHFRNDIISDTCGVVGAWIRKHYVIDPLLIPSAVKISYGCQLLTCVQHLENSLPEELINNAWHHKHLQMVFGHNNSMHPLHAVMDTLQILQEAVPQLRSNKEKSIDIMFGLDFGVHRGLSLASWAILQPESVFPKHLSLELFIWLPLESQVTVLGTLIDQNAIDETVYLLTALSKSAVINDVDATCRVQGGVQMSFDENEFNNQPSLRRLHLELKKHKTLEIGLISLLLTSPDRELKLNKENRLEILGYFLFELGDNDDMVMVGAGKVLCKQSLRAIKKSIRNLMTIGLVYSAPLSADNKLFQTLFACLLSEAHVESVKDMLLEIEAYPPDKSAYGALMHASMLGKTALVESLLGTDGVDVNMQDKFGYSALMHASNNGHTDVVKLLIKQRGVNVNLSNHAGRSALLLASSKGHVAVVKLLLKAKKMDVNLQTPKGITALMLASGGGHVAVVKLLLNETNIAVNVQEEQGWTALSTASRNGYTRAVEVLLKAKGVRVDLPTKNGATALVHASSKGYTSVVKLLLKMDYVSVNHQDNQGLTALIWSSSYGHKNVVELLLGDQSVEINLATKEGATALILACANGHTDVVKLLLTVKAVGVNLQNKEGWTALSLASRHGHTDVVKQLLTVGGVDINLQNNEGVTALMLASSNNHTAVVEQLIEANDINIKLASHDGTTALAMASSSGHTDVVKMLLTTKRVGVNMQDKKGSTALILACANGHTDVVKLLLTVKAVGVNLQNKKSWTALSLASRHGHTDVVKQLLTVGGVDINLPNNEGVTALMLASSSGHTAVVELLLGADGMDVHLTHNTGENVLWYASSAGHSMVVDQLLKMSGVRVNYQSSHAKSDGMTALHVAAANGHVAVVKRLLQVVDVDLNLKSKDGRTALMHASSAGHLMVVKQLLTTKKRGDVNLQNKEGWTALSLALRNGHIEVVKQILTVDGVDINLQNKHGWTALMLASSSGHTAVVELLLGADGMDVHLTDNKGENVLWYASRAGHSVVVDQLLNMSDVRVNYQSSHAKSDGMTALHVAAAKGHVAVVKRLLQVVEVDLNLKSKDGRTALMHASSAGHAAVVDLLKAKESDSASSSFFKFW